MRLHGKLIYNDILLKKIVKNLETDFYQCYEFVFLNEIDIFKSSLCFREIFENRFLF